MSTERSTVRTALPRERRPRRHRRVLAQSAVWLTAPLRYAAAVFGSVRWPGRTLRLAVARAVARSAHDAVARIAELDDESRRRLDKHVMTATRRVSPQLVPSMVWSQARGFLIAGLACAAAVASPFLVDRSGLDVSAGTGPTLLYAVAVLFVIGVAVLGADFYDGRMNRLTAFLLLVIAGSLLPSLAIPAEAGHGGARALDALLIAFACGCVVVWLGIRTIDLVVGQAQARRRSRTPHENLIWLLVWTLTVWAVPRPKPPRSRRRGRRRVAPARSSSQRPVPAEIRHRSHPVISSGFSLTLGNLRRNNARAQRDFDAWRRTVVVRALEPIALLIEQSVPRQLRSGDPGTDAWIAAEMRGVAAWFRSLKRRLLLGEPNGLDDVRRGLESSLVSIAERKWASLERAEPATAVSTPWPRRIRRLAGLVVTGAIPLVTIIVLDRIAPGLPENVAQVAIPSAVLWAIATVLLGVDPQFQAKVSMIRELGALSGSPPGIDGKG